MLLTWTPQAWEDYLYWQHTDKRTVKRINELLRDAMRNPFEGLGKPEPLRFDLVGCWSRRINQEDRLVYKPCSFHQRAGLFYPVRQSLRGAPAPIFPEHVAVGFQRMSECLDHVCVVRLHAAVSAVLDFPDFVFHVCKP